MKKQSGFSLLELMIVVAILADIAVIALPSYQRSRQFAQDTRFMVDLRAGVEAFEMYAAEHNSYPPNAGTSVVPAGMIQYLGGMNWGGDNTIGGQWSWDNNRNGSTAAVVTVFAHPPDDLRMTRIDERLDNGVLETGGFRKLGDTRYGFVIE